jgi:hypothetical protein
MTQRCIAFCVAQERRGSNSVDEGFGGPPATSASLLWIALDRSLPAGLGVYQVVTG